MTFKKTKINQQRKELNRIRQKTNEMNLSDKTNQIFYKGRKKERKTQKK